MQKVLTQTNLFILFTFLILGIFFARIKPPATVHDTYWHLAIGRQVWTEKQIPEEDKFVYGPQDTGFNSTEWLSGLIFYSIVKYFGFNGLLFLRTLLGSIAIYFFYRTLKLTIANDWLAVATTIFVAYILAFYVSLDERPGIFSLVFLSIINYLFLQYFYSNKINRLTFVLPLFFLLWPNLHPYSIIGILIFSLWLLILLTRPATKIRNKILFVATYLFSITLLATQYQKVFLFLQANKLTGHISEFASLKERIFPPGKFQPFFVSIDLEIYIYLLLLFFFIILIAFSIFQKKLDKKHYILLFFYLTVIIVPLRFFREIPLAILLSLPFFAFLTKLVFKKYGQYVLTLSYLFSILASLTILISILVGYPFIEGKETSTRNIRYSHAEEFIRRHLETRRLFTLDEWNNYFIWHNPNLKTFSDVQQEYRKPEDLFDQQKLVSPNENPEELLRKYNIDTVVNTHLDTRWGSFTKVHDLEDWQLVYLDDIAIVYAREDIIRQRPVDLSVIRPELRMPLKFESQDEKLAVDQLEKLLEYDPTNGFARIELIIYFLDKDVMKAKSLAEESRRLIPNNPWYSHFLAIVYSRQGNCQLAKQFRDEAKSKSSNELNTLQVTNQAIQNCL